MAEKNGVGVEVHQKISNLDDQVACLLDIQRQFFSGSDQSMDSFMDCLIKEIAKLERMQKNGFVRR